MQLSHFTAVLVFAFFVSIVFGITQKDNTKDMIRYGAFCFALFAGGTIAASWLMWFIRH